MKTTRNIKVREARGLDFILATLAFLSLFLLRLAAGQTAGAQAASNQTTYTVTELSTLGGYDSLANAKNNLGQVGVPRRWRGASIRRWGSYRSTQSSGPTA